VRLSGITPESLVDGPGLRYVIFAQGCLHQCPHCHNPESWDVNGGAEFSIRHVIRTLKKHKNNVRGVTFSGGEPFLQAGELAEVALSAHLIGWDVVTYSGFTYEELIEMKDSGVMALLSASDILIDGRYIHELRDTGLQFRGSSNQRIIAVAETQRSGQVVLWKSLIKRQSAIGLNINV
jgi:anaerobic ribonucleoside-triphosphate reductase activating protein